MKTTHQRNLQRNLESTQYQLVQIRAGDVLLAGELHLPPRCTGLVVLVQSSNDQRRFFYQSVAETLQKSGIATLLVSLLCPDEETADLRSNHMRFNTRLLAKRLVAVTHWLHHNTDTASLSIGYLGVHTAAGAVLTAAAQHPELVQSLVLCRGRSDLATAAIPQVQAPTLLIAEKSDPFTFQASQNAMANLHCQSHLEMINGATKPSEIDRERSEVAQLADWWFQWHLQPSI